ncbi:hypothetical protein PV04_00791 [Phialophora macrospora]|uniref:Uncharacterized protein n=1 Tax=Phialophora macrospora TaxID=1851006 RepID=A0A0D2GJP9_9EURO|nr:hypothetical protein PV04_00791 [Phialophora macrospora]
MPSSVRMLVGLTPPDLADGSSKREPCTKTITVEQMILVLQWSRGESNNKAYKVFSTIYPVNGMRTFEHIPETLSAPQNGSAALMRDAQTYLHDHQFRSWDIKCVYEMDATDATSPEESDETHLVLLERNKPCKCHKMWRPIHQLKIVRTATSQTHLEQAENDAMSTTALVAPDTGSARGCGKPLFSLARPFPHIVRW